MTTADEILTNPAARPGRAARPPAEAYRTAAVGLFLLAEPDLGGNLRLGLLAFDRLPPLDREGYLSDAGPLVEALWQTFRGNPARQL